MAYDAAGNLVYLGETAAVVLPTGTMVGVNCLTYTGSSTTLLAEGKNLLSKKDFITAKDKLMMSANSNLKNDEAKLYYSLSRIISIYDNVGSSKSTQMDSIKKMLDASGISYFSLNTIANSTPTAPLKVTYPKQLPLSTPNSGQMRDYIRYYLAPEIDGAITNLSTISPNFSVTFSPAVYNMQGNDIIIDYADINVLKAILCLAKANISMATAYNFDFNIVDNINKNIPDLNFYDKNIHGDLFNITTLLQNNKNIGTVSDPTLIAKSKDAYNLFITNYETAFNDMKARTTSGQYLFVLDPPTSPTSTTTSSRLDSVKITSQLDSAKQLQKAFNGKTTLAPKVVPISGSTTGYYNYLTMTQYSAIRPDTNNIVDFSMFFNSTQPVNMRTKFVDCTKRTLLDVTTDKTLSGLYPSGYTTSPIYDPTYGGGWDIDSIVLSPNKIDVINGLCN